MSDLPPGSPLPPPPPPPSSVPPGFQPPPGYPPPPASYPAEAAPGQVPPPYLPVAAAGAGIGLMSQFRGSALWSILIGVVSIAVPLFSNYVFRLLPLVGLVYGVRAIRRGQMIGGVAGIALNVIGGIFSLIGLFAH